MLEQILVQFKGEGSGPEPLSWGLWAQWGAYQIEGRLLSAGGAMKLDEGVTVSRLATMLGLIVSRHQSLRTVIELDEGVPRQRVLESGELVLEVAHPADDVDPAALAEDIRRRYDEKGWDIYNYDTVRMAVVCVDGTPSHFVAMYNHFFIDGSGIDAIGRDMRANLDLDSGRQLAPVEGMTPIEQMRSQQTASAERQQRVSLRHWETTMRSMPPRLFGESADKRSPRFWEATYNSPAAHLAVQVLMDRTKLHSSVIILAAYAKALAGISGKDMIVLRSLVSNRYRPGLRESVSPVAQSGLTVIDASDCPFDELVDRAFRAQVAGGRHGYYDPRELWALIDRVAEDRGQKPDLTVYYSDRRRAAAQGLEEGPLPSREAAVALLPQSTLSWGDEEDIQNGATAFLLVNPAKDAIEYTLSADTHKLSPAQMEELMREVESVLVSGAFPA